MWDFSITNFEGNLAVVIGINNYQNGIYPLKTAVNDAVALADLLEKNYNYRVLRLFPHENNQNEATLENINKLLSETVTQKIQSLEVCRLLFYFAGHGIARNGENGPAGYLVPQNAQLGKIETFLPMQQLYKALTNLSGHHLLVILDCCFAGTFRWSSTRNVISDPDKIHKEHYDRFIRHPAWQAITSAAYNQEAIDFLTDQRGIIELENERHSPFAKALIEALRDMKADLTKDGVITAPELYIYVRDEVEKISSESQTPGLWPLHQHDRGEYIFTPLNFNPEELKPAPKPNENNNPY